MKKKGFTLIELLVVISIIAMLLAILMPALSKVKKIAQRVVCATNLKGLGTAQTVYSQDYEDAYAVQGKRGKHTWDWATDQFQNLNKNWSDDGTITIGASLYLLVREADVSPKSFICPSGDESEYDGTNTSDKDIVELWDFGNEDLAPDSGYPYQHVSYAYQMPYALEGGESSHTADGTKNASFAVMADKNPYLDPKITNIGNPTAQTWTDTVAGLVPYWLTNSQYSESDWRVKAANSYSHGRDGQNVVFADGHASFEKTSDVGVQNDGIYLPRGGAGDEEEQIRRGFFGALSGAPVHAPTQQWYDGGGSDSFLVNDDVHSADAHP
ncbi:MAG: type II secretion system protein [Planctomycetota bacterium]|jgi:prepilin-type N-terminal cleavage/methylation domain-containing protein/prepilin-type processing-associated H-X9-DG protein